MKNFIISAMALATIRCLAQQPDIILGAVKVRKAGWREPQRNATQANPALQAKAELDLD